MAKEGIHVKTYKEDYWCDTITVMFATPQDKMLFLLKYKMDDLYNDTSRLVCAWPVTCGERNPRGMRGTQWQHSKIVF